MFIRAYYPCHHWADIYKRPRQRLLSVQDQITLLVADKQLSFMIHGTSYFHHLLIFLPAVTMQSSDTQSRPKVLITGINGFIAAQVAAAFLRAGYSVRGSYWSQNPVPKQLLDALYTEIPGDSGHESSFVELVEVEDITRPGSFDEVVRGMSNSAGSLLQLLPSLIQHLFYTQNRG